MITLPFGCRFKPRDEELLYFLERKAKNQPLPWEGGVVEKNLYKGAPWKIFDKNDPWQSYKLKRSTIYVFTRVARIGSKNRVRKAGEGTWHGETGESDIEGPVLGSKRTFNYEVGSSYDNLDDFKGLGHWTMHEYSLTNDDSDYVICRITVDYSKELKVKPRKPMKRSHEQECLKEKPKRVKKRSDEKESSKQDIVQPIFEAVEPVLEAVVVPTLEAVEQDSESVQPFSEAVAPTLEAEEPTIEPVHKEAVEPVLDQQYYSPLDEIILRAQGNMKYLDHQPFFSSNFSTMEPIFDPQYMPSSFDVQEPSLEAVQPIHEAMEPLLQTLEPMIDLQNEASRFSSMISSRFSVDSLFDEDAFKLY